MKIAQIAPLIESVPPRLYGGTERVVSWLTDQLVDMGHEVTLFASGDSLTKAELVPCVERALRLSEPHEDPVLRHLAMMDEVASRAHEFDILHFHVDGFHFPLFRGRSSRVFTTLHGRQDLPSLRGFYRRFSEYPLISISDHQRLPLPDANFVATIHHGLPLTLHRPTMQPAGDYLAFLGRISPEKGVERAIEIAARVNMPLRIAAKVDAVDAAYFREVVAPLMDRPNVTFIGEIDERQKTRFLGDARALLFPIDWPEPFGLVVIEAMACGTPVLAFRAGSVPEIIQSGVNGVMVGSVEEAVARLPSALALDRQEVRRTFVQRFSAQRMARDYLELFSAAIMADPRVKPRRPHGASIPAVPALPLGARAANMS
ncbi:glycosyltransferase family 4 protein [Geminicoccus roseus]|uniref:glycosyltransferase family 4 protein n=1 Tax=Geminicoccus roseus TaxID=404900 RepID=UPI0003F9F83A|nr:glycosyltransferase family 4 protein [Geminicoccus roseus]